MELAIGTTFNYSIPFETMLPLLKSAGFDIISVGARREHSGYHTVKGRRRIRRLTREHRISIDSIHAPLWLEGDISSPKEAIRIEGVETIRNAIHACSDLEVGILILHLNKMFEGKELSKRVESAMKSMKSISDYAREKSVSLAIENLPEDPSDTILEESLRRFPGSHIGVCYDSSHANLTKAPFRILERYGDRVIAVHISDNGGEADDHVLPFEGNIDWAKFSETFRALNYQGTLLLEVEMRRSAFQNPETFLAEAKKRGERLIEF